MLLSAMCVAAVAQEAPKIKKKEFLNMEAGSKEAWKAVGKANKYYKKDRLGAYRIAAELYNTAIEYNDAYAPLLYRAGVSEAISGHDRMAKRHLEDASDLSPMVSEDCLYWLAVTKQHLNMFDEAKRDFDDCIANFGKKTKKRLYNDVELRIGQCGLGQGLKKQAELAVAQPLPGTINSTMPEVAPVFCILDSALYFGSMRQTDNVSKKRRKDYDPCSDIFVAKASNGTFQDVNNVGKPLSKKKDEFPLYMPMSCKSIFFLRKCKNVHFAQRKSVTQKWGSATKFFHKAMSVSFSQDSSMVILTCYKGKDHQGGWDIYFSKKNRSGYSKPKNLGDIVNTQYNELMATFGSSDTVIYFAHDGQGSVGGFDVMKTQYRNGKWNKPVNMGLGLNSGTDDNFFQMVPGEERIAYYASKRDGGQGDYDIYKVLLLNKPIIQYQPMPWRALAADFAKEPPIKLEDPEVIRTMRLTVVKGKVTDFDHSKNLYANVSITDNATNQLIQQVMTDPETGDFTVMLPSGKNYAMTVSTEGYMFHSENFNIPATSSYQEVHKEIGLLPMDPGSKVVLNNVFFDSGKSNLRTESFGELNRLSEIFKHYPNLVIEVSGHTDNQGNRAYNIQLSQQRAEAVREYLIGIGVNPDQVQAKGYGPDQPRDTNATEAGRQNNRRVEAKIVRN